MLKTILLASVAALLAAGTANADTIFLKNGSVIKGKVTSFVDEQFVIVLNTGSDTAMSKATIFIGDVARIDFGAGSASGGETTSPLIDLNSSHSTSTAKEAARGSTPVEVSREPVRTSGSPPAEKDPAESPALEPAPKKGSGQIQSTVVEVPGKRDWTSTGLIIKRGERVRITATGSVTLDSTNDVTAGPDGIEQGDPKKLMSDRPTGALIAVIGADNDDFIFIGKSAEFIAAREGLLFLSVNEGTLPDNLGSFKATIERQASRTSLR